MKKILRIAATATILFIMACLIIFPDRYISVARQGITLWATAVVPSLFPFFFLTLILTKLGTLEIFTKKTERLTEGLFRCNGMTTYVFLMSILSGYPVGSRLISELSERGCIDCDEATRMSVLCSTSGPLFIMGTVGVGMFGNKVYGAAIFASHVMSAVICGLIFRKYGNFCKKMQLLPVRQNADNVLYECIYSSVISILCVGGFICIFYLLASILADFKILFPLTSLLEKIFAKTGYGDVISEGIAYGLIECTNGCKILSSVSTPLAAAIACGIISFGGLSVMFQSAIYLLKAKSNLKIFFFSKILQSLISAALCFIILNFGNIF